MLSGDIKLEWTVTMLFVATGLLQEVNAELLTVQLHAKSTTANLTSHNTKITFFKVSI